MTTPTVVIKIGTNVLVEPSGALDQKTFQHLVEQITTLKHKGCKVIVISSGAIGFGKTLFKGKLKAVDQIVERQVLAAIGQVGLMKNYAETFAQHQVQVAQVLATKSDFLNRDHYLNMRRCFTGLIENNVIPIVNENDTVAVSELMFTDNDELASLVATMLKADKLIILSNINGLYTGNPHDPKSQIIPEVKMNDKLEGIVSASKSQFGRGGMQTKLQMALKLAKLGVTVHIAHGKEESILLKILAHQKVGTTFIPQKVSSNIKRWLSFSEGLAQAKIVVNECTEELLHSPKVISLLPVGISKIEGEFKKGDIVKIINEKGTELGLGKAEYSTQELSLQKGKKGGKPFIHYNYMFIK